MESCTRIFENDVHNFEEFFHALVLCVDVVVRGI